MFRPTNNNPTMHRRKLSQVPFPALAKINPRTATGTVEGAITETDCAITSDYERQLLLKFRRGLVCALVVIGAAPLNPFGVWRERTGRASACLLQ